MARYDLCLAVFNLVMCIEWIEYGYLILLPYARLSMVELNEVTFITRLPNDASIR